MVDEPHGNSDKQDSYDERDDPEVPTRDIPEDAEVHDAEEDHRRSQRKIAAVYEWAIGAAFPWIWKRIITSSNFWTAAATVVIAIATMVYTHYARKQWSAMNDTLSEIKKQTPSIQAQATSAQNSVTEAQRQTRIDERPWIKFKLRDWDTTSNPPKSAELTFTLNQPFVVPVQFVNIGKTTALNVQGGVIIKLVEMGQEPSMPTAQEPL